MDKSLLIKARRRLLRMHYESKVGHIGGNLSCLDIIMTLYHDIMKPEDQFILSKGHSAGALYVTMWSKGLISDEELSTFHADNTRLPGHPPANTFEEILFATGSLGHGVSLACGLALAKKLKGETGQIYVLTSDGEMQEGSVWEGLMFAIHHRLNNLTIIVDNNGLQGFGTTKEVSGISRGITEDKTLINMFEGFGMRAIGCMPNHCGVMFKNMIESNYEYPIAIVVETTKGQGVSFMENRMDSHYLPMSESQYQQALSENPE